jgi:hypothetical protein
VRLRLALSLALLTSAGVGVAAEQRVFVLAPAKGAALLQQCSRGTPQGVDGFWMPSSQDVSELEGLLQPFLETNPSARPLLPLEQYHRQYVGFTKGGKRYIYGNFYAQPRVFAAHQNEAADPILVCDGGRAFWGIVFSLDLKAFIDLAINGVA